MQVKVTNIYREIKALIFFSLYGIATAIIYNKQKQKKVTILLCSLVYDENIVDIKNAAQSKNNNNVVAFILNEGAVTPKNKTRKKGISNQDKEAPYFDVLYIVKTISAETPSIDNLKFLKNSFCFKFIISPITLNHVDFSVIIGE